MLTLYYTYVIINIVKNYLMMKIVTLNNNNNNNNNFIKIPQHIICTLKSELNYLIKFSKLIIKLSVNKFSKFYFSFLFLPIATIKLLFVKWDFNVILREGFCKCEKSMYINYMMGSGCICTSPSIILEICAK